MLIHLAVISGPVYNDLSRFFVEVVLILVLVRLLGRLLLFINQPMVIGEIIAGILLGPSALGQIPGFSSNIFPPQALNYLSLIANVGLCFFMFFLGLEVDLGGMTRSMKSSIPTAVVSIIIPFAAGTALSQWFYNIGDPNTASSTTFLLFLGTALSFTAFPVLARLLTTSRLLASPLGIQALSIAAVDDLLAWCTLALTLSYANGGSWLLGLYVALIAIGMVLFLGVVVKPFLEFLQQWLRDNGDPNDRNFIAILLLGQCVSAWFAEIIGVHAFFGSFVFGIMVPKDPELLEELAPKIELLVIEFFLPLYFANSGLATNLLSLDTGEIWAAFFVVLAVGSAAKILPVMLSARLCSSGGVFNGQSWKECLTLGVLMNTRGLIALIVLNVGLSNGVLNTQVFSMMVLFSLVTTFATPPLLTYLYETEYHLTHPLPTVAIGVGEEVAADTDTHSEEILKQMNMTKAEIMAEAIYDSPLNGISTRNSIDLTDNQIVHPIKPGLHHAFSLPIQYISSHHMSNPQTNYDHRIGVDEHKHATYPIEEVGRDSAEQSKGSISPTSVSRSSTIGDLMHTGPGNTAHSQITATAAAGVANDFTRTGSIRRKTIPTLLQSHSISTRFIFQLAAAEEEKKEKENLQKTGSKGRKEDVRRSSHSAAPNSIDLVEFNHSNSKVSHQRTSSDNSISNNQINSHLIAFNSSNSQHSTFSHDYDEQQSLSPHLHRAISTSNEKSGTIQQPALNRAHTTPPVHLIVVENEIQHGEPQVQDNLNINQNDNNSISHHTDEDPHQNLSKTAPAVINKGGVSQLTRSGSSRRR